MELMIAVCDDLSEERAGLTRVIREYFSSRDLSHRVQTFSDGGELLDAFKSTRFDIVFLDIYMPYMSGMEAAQKIRELNTDCALIFVTTSQDYGVESYAVQASDYLVKPYKAQDVKNALDWCLEQLSASKRMLTVISEWKKIEIPVRELIYIEICGHKAHLHLVEQVVCVRQGLDSLEADIGHDDFLRCHRSYLVNMNYIKAVEKSFFRMSDDSLVPIGSTNAAQIRDRFMDWTFIKTWEAK